MNRYINETKRLYSVLEARLATTDFLVGGKFSLADIKAWPWYVPLSCPHPQSFCLRRPNLNLHLTRPRRVRLAPRLEIDLGEFPNVKAWVERIEARPAVQAGLKAHPQ